MEEENPFVISKENHTSSQKNINKTEDGSSETKAASSASGASTSHTLFSPILGCVHSVKSVDGDRWMDYQEAAFVRWINHELDKSELHHNNDNGDDEALHWAYKLYTSDEFWMIKSKIEREFILKRMKINENLNVHYDVGFRADIAKLFVRTYSHWWLKIAINVFTGRQYSYDHPLLDLQKMFLRTIFIEKDEKDCSLDPHQSAVARLFVLVVFLDFIKNKSRNMPAPRLLFQKQGGTSSADVLEGVGKRALQGEGDLVRHLSGLGAKVTCVQCAVDEVPYHIDLLPIDLRSGIQIARLLKRVTQDESFGDVSLGADANFYLSNMKKIFNLLEKKGFNFNIKSFSPYYSNCNRDRISPADIVNGHREKTLAFLWKIVCGWKIPVLVSHSVLHKEIMRLYESYQIDECKIPQHVHLEEEQGQLASSNAGHLSLLFEWIWAVAALHNIYIENFCASLADGRVLCCLLSMYRPEILPLEELAFTQQGDHTGSGRYWMELFVERSRSIGGLPPLISLQDLMESELPDEKMMILVISFLSKKLLE